MNYLIIAIFAAFLGFSASAFAAEPAASDKQSGRSEEKMLGQDPQSRADQASQKRQSECASMQGLQAQSQVRSENQPQQSPDQQRQSQTGSARPATAGSQTVVGEFAGMEGDNYVVKDAGGRSVCILSNYATFIDDTFVAGDTIEARIAPDGSAARIRRVTDTRLTGSQGPSGQMERLSEARPDKELTEAKQNVPIKGELLQIQGEFYTVRDASGNEVRLHVNKDTKMDSAFKVGDNVEAERTSAGHALYIKKTQEAGTRRERE